MCGIGRSLPSCYPDLMDTFVTVALLLTAGVFLVLPLLGFTYVSVRGRRVVRCPSAGGIAVLRLDAAHASISNLVAVPELRVKECSLWPKRKGCGQGCLRQVELAPRESLLRTIRRKWFAGQSCGICREPIRRVEVATLNCAVRNSDGITKAWSELDDGDFSRVLWSSEPVCWNCHIAETFRRCSGRCTNSTPRAAP